MGIMPADFSYSVIKALPKKAGADECENYQLDTLCITKMQNA